MKKAILISATINLLFSTAIYVHADTFRVRYDANSAIINSKTAEVVDDLSLSSNKGITLKKGINALISGERREPDLAFNINVPNDGSYVMTTYTVTDEEGNLYFENASTKFESLFMRMQFDDQLSINRVIAVPWIRPLQTIGRFDLQKEQKLKLWLPRGVRLEYVEFQQYNPPTVPKAVSSFVPNLPLPKEHPRLWMTQSTLPIVKKRLTSGEENSGIWKDLQTSAKIKYIWKQNQSKEVKNDQELEKKCREKAFYYLMTGNLTVGKEAVSLIDSYLPTIIYDNILDGTRSIGQTIYTTSLVYDWCYSLISESQKQKWISNMIRLAEEMEIGWPPFAQSVVNGHGNEAQVSRDLLSMAIATADENPIAYQYCSYLILNDLAPMKDFEFQSPRHPQGVNYGAYRIGWDLHAALLFKNISGKEIFNSNIKELFKYWTYMRTPHGQMLRDGDGYNASPPGKDSYYWRNPLTMFLAYVYTGSAYLKSQFYMQGGPEKIEPYLFLILNLPELQADEKHNYPLTIDFGNITGGMIARTGWDNQDDIVVEIKGGGVRNGAHQHADAGAIQLYYRGFQFGDIGQYLFAGTPYDKNFNRRSVSHSMMLVNNPNEKFGKGLLNDSGQRYNSPFPKTPAEATVNSTFKNGQVISGSFGPSATTPDFSYFSVDLADCYSKKVKSYIRSFCFINTKREDVPGIIILNDYITTSDSTFQKFWQVNTHNTPRKIKYGLLLENRSNDTSPKGRTFINMLLPKSDQRSIQILEGEDVFTIDGVYLKPPHQNLAERTGKRTLISPKSPRFTDRFLSVFQIVNGKTEPIPFNYTESNANFIISISDKIICMSNSKQLIQSEVYISIPDDKSYQLALMGLKEGTWTLSNLDKSKLSSFDVKARNNSFFFDSIAPGNYRLSPG